MAFRRRGERRARAQREYWAQLDADHAAARSFLQRAQRAQLDRHQGSGFGPRGLDPDSLRSVNEDLFAGLPQMGGAAENVALMRQIVERARQRDEDRISDTDPILELPSSTELVDALSGEVQTVLRRRSKGRTGRPAIGVLTTGSLNAVARPIDGIETSYVVALDQSFFTFVHLIAKSAARCIPAAKRPDGGIGYAFSPELAIKTMSKNPRESVFRFTDAVMSYAAVGTAGMAEQYWAHADWIPLAGSLTRCIELFVIAHEHAHFELGHLAEVVSRAKSRPQIPDASARARSWELEREADALGFLIAVEAAGDQGIDFNTAAIAPLVYLHAQETVELAVWTLALGSYEGATAAMDRYSNPTTSRATHPPARDRRERVSRAAYHEFTDADSLRISIETFESIMDHFRRHAMAIAASAATRGLKPAPEWQHLLAD